MKHYDYFDDIKSQSQFCTELMIRLNNSISKSGRGLWSGMENHCQKQNDIIRIRRELNTLKEMLNPWWEREEE